MEILYRLLDVLLPFEWLTYTFMKNALLTTVLVTVALGFLGTMVVNQKLVFFTDVIGHSALTGVAIGVVLGFFNPIWAMLIFAVLLSFIINFVKKLTRSSMDTVLGVTFAFVVSLGVVILSRKGGFAKYSSYLIGDILTISPSEIISFVFLICFVLLFWNFFSNSLYLISINPSLARSRGRPVFMTELLFTMLVAVVVTVSIRSIGILVINSLLVLPAATSRILSKNIHDYTVNSVAISLLCGIAGLVTSYYCGTATGATMALFATAAYVLAVLKQFFMLKYKRVEI